MGIKYAFLVEIAVKLVSLHYLIAQPVTLILLESITHLQQTLVPVSVDIMTMVFHQAAKVFNI